MLMPLASVQGTASSFGSARIEAWTLAKFNMSGWGSISEATIASPRRIDVHFHLIPPFYSEAVYEAGRGPAIGKYPDWTPQLALELMDGYGIEVALTSLAQPGVSFGTKASAKTLARRCNEYAAELVARWPKRFGAFATMPMWSIGDALDEITYCLDVLEFDGVSL